MIGRNFHRIGASLSALALLAMPGQASACWFCHRPAPVIANYAPAPCTSCATPVVANYAPVVAAPACAPCTQTCNYVPQTCYRSVITSVPVTTYRPVSTCDPCTGCPRTVLQPVTAYMQQTQLVPYTSYRPVMSTSCYSPCATSPCASGACGTAVTAAYAPAYSSGYAPMSMSSYAPTSTYAAPAPSCCGTPSVAAPPTVITPAPAAPATIVPADPASVPPTLESTGTIQESSAIKSESRLQVTPIPPMQSPASAPRELSPQDRSAARPLRGWSYVPVAQGANAPPVEDSGWRSSR